MAGQEITFHQLGDTALLIKFREEIDLEINSQVHHVKLFLESKKIVGLHYFIPAFCSLTIGYDPNLWNFDDLCERLQRILGKLPSQAGSLSGRRLNIPVCYDPMYGIDLMEVSENLGLATEEVINLHTNRVYHVYMLGFLPGFVYLGDLPEALRCRRKQKPRILVPAQSVGLAGRQTGIYPLNAPGGWQIIGQVPMPIFNPGEENSFLFRIGDQVSFYSITTKKFQQILKQSYQEQIQNLFY